MYGNFLDGGLFLINTVFDLYLLVLIVRLMLAYVEANYFNPVTRFIIILTKPLVDPLRRIIPNYRRIEFSTLTLILCFELIKIILLSALLVGIPSIFTLFKLAILDALKLFLQTLFYAILIQALLSWFQQNNMPITQILQQITSPILRPLQRFIPPVGGLDLTPLIALLLLQLLIIFLI